MAKKKTNYWIEIRNEDTKETILATWINRINALTIRELLKVWNNLKKEKARKRNIFLKARGWK